MPSTYFPPLSNIIGADSFPAELGNFSSSLTALLDNLQYKNLRYSKSHEGDAGFYSLTVIPINEIGIEIPGTNGMALLFNPDGSGNTEIPISFEYKWEILKYARQFRSGSFTGSIDDLYSLLIDVAGATPKSLMEQAIMLFIVDTNPLQKFVTEVNAKYSPANALQVNSNVADPFDDVYQQAITSPNSLDVKTIILTDYLNSGLSFEETFKRVVDLFEGWLGRFTHEKIKNFFIHGANIQHATALFRFE